jgi:hypothetical protein
VRAAALAEAAFSFHIFRLNDVSRFPLCYESGEKGGAHGILVIAAIKPHFR